MTDEELKQLVTSLAIAQRETDRQFKEIAKEAKEIAKEAEKRKKEAEKEAEKRKKEAEKEAEKRNKEADERNKEAEQRKREIDKQLKELGQQIGGLGKKFGSFTEGLALPSMTKILRERFKMEVISPSVRVSKNGIDAEIDVLAYSNSAINEVYVVEVKSHLREEAISQLNTLMANFRTLFPEHGDKKLYGIIAAVDMSETIKKRVLESGFYVARIQDETFSLDTPDTFQAKCF